MKRVPFRFQLQHNYRTQAGKVVRVINRVGHRGYECLKCSDGKYRYDRSTHNEDAGRCTGTPHDYSYPHNFQRHDRP